jgi:mannose-1-phosphate guanylyltransferase/mannose-6-phosphate isomerase
MFPKQLLPLVGARTMLQETALRLAGQKDCADQPLVICNEAHRFLVAEQLRDLEIPARIILEPEGRNTAPAAALAAILTLRNGADYDDSPLLLVMPADHVIRDCDAFLAAVRTGASVAEKGQLVTFGIVPTHAHTGYGYIEADTRTMVAAPVSSFVEKPDKKTAVGLLETNRYFWNSGIFLFRSDTYIQELKKFDPEMVIACTESIDRAVTDTDFIRPDAESFRFSPSNSIDYAVMERTDNAAVVPMDVGWSDVGSWGALHQVSQQDKDGNAIAGDVIATDCHNSYLSSASRLVAAVGLENIVVVEDKDSVLIASKDKAQDVKVLVDKLKDLERPETELHRQVFRPWGSYDSLEEDEGFQVKRLIVNPGAVLSLQKHARRAEHWTVVRGSARITLNDSKFDLGGNESTYIAIGDVHRIANVTDEPVHIIEVQCGDYLGEDDIVRLEDNYGREGTNT